MHSSPSPNLYITARLRKFVYVGLVVADKGVPFSYTYIRQSTGRPSRATSVPHLLVCYYLNTFTSMFKAHSLVMVSPEAWNDRLCMKWYTVAGFYTGVNMIV